MLPYLFRALQVGLCGAIAALVWSAVAPFARGVSVAGFDASAPPVDAQATPPVEDYQVIDGRNLFAARGQEAAVDAAPIEPSKLQVALLGTVAGDASEAAYAIIRNNGQQKAEVVRVNNTIAAGVAKVVRIEPRRVVIEHEGRLEAIEVQLRAPVRKLPDQGGMTQADASARLTARVEQRMREGMQALNDAELMANPQASIALGTNADGTLGGFQLQTVAPGGKLASLGLQAGDRIVSVDGIRLNGVVPLAEVMMSFGMDQTKVLEVERNGGITSIQVPAEQVVDLIQEVGAF